MTVSPDTAAEGAINDAFSTQGVMLWNFWTRQEGSTKVRTYTANGPTLLNSGETSLHLHSHGIDALSERLAHLSDSSNASFHFFATRIKHSFEWCPTLVKGKEIMGMWNDGGCVLVETRAKSRFVNKELIQMQLKKAFRGSAHHSTLIFNNLVVSLSNITSNASSTERALFDHAYTGSAHKFMSARQKNNIIIIGEADNTFFVLSLICSIGCVNRLCIREVKWEWSMMNQWWGLETEHIHEE